MRLFLNFCVIYRRILCASVIVTFDLINLIVFIRLNYSVHNLFNIAFLLALAYLAGETMIKVLLKRTWTPYNYVYCVKNKSNLTNWEFCI